MLIGIIGKPNSGKSTFFKSATLSNVLIANYPFATIKPNHGIGFVKVECIDKEFNVQCNPRFGFCTNGKRFVPIELLDVAGLVPGAHEGKGLGNQFLNDLNQADALIHVVDISGSTNEKGEPVNQLSYNPSNDIRFLEHELDMWYLRIIQDGWEKFARTIKQTNENIAKAIAKQLSGLKVNEEIAEQSIRELKLSNNILLWDEKELFSLARELRKKTKPMLIAANKLDIYGSEKNLERIKQEFPDYQIIGCSAEIELALNEAAKNNVIEYIPGEKNFKVIKNLNEKQKQAIDFIKKFLEEHGTTNIQQVFDSIVFSLLKYIAIFPGGVNKLQDKEGRILPDCILLKNGSTALDFAYAIHTDLGKNFIRAIDVRTKRTIGKEYILKHRDVIEIVAGR